jgi:hypothetical protein
MDTSGEDPTNAAVNGITLPSDLTVFVIAAVCVLIIAFISAFEGLKGKLN